VKKLAILKNCSIIEVGCSKIGEGVMA